jgi:hypothetical protein
MNRKVWIVLMALVTMGAGTARRVRTAATAADSCPTATCTSVFDCDFSCTICRFGHDGIGRCA